MSNLVSRFDLDQWLRPQSGCKLQAIQNHMKKVKVSISTNPGVVYRIKAQLKSSGAKEYKMAMKALIWIEAMQLILELQG